MWVITKSRFWIEDGSVGIQVTTSTECHLFLLVTIHKPTNSPVWTTRRGAVVQCGIHFFYTNLQCYEQEEEGITAIHTFFFPFQYGFLRYYAFFADNCDPSLATQTGPPMTINLVIKIPPFCDLRVKAEPSYPPTNPPWQTLRTSVTAT